MTLIVIIIWVIMYEIQRLSSAPKSGGTNFFSRIVKSKLKGHSDVKAQERIFWMV